MALFVSSTTSVTRHGAFAIELTPPASITPIGTGVVGMAGQFPWGPIQAPQTPASLKDANDTFAPPGTSRTSAAVLMFIRKGWPQGFRMLRVIGVSAAKSTAILIATGPTSIATVTAKYEGTAGNSLVATVSAASDGDANHFNLAVTITGASGSTTDTLSNLNYSGTGADSDITGLASSLRLVGSIAKLASGRPANGTYTFSAGTSPAVVSSDYVGTQGTGDKGLSTLEGDRSVRHVFTDDCGSSMRAAVNAGIVAHAGYVADRLGYINGNSGQTLAQVATDVANYRSERAVYVDPWAYEIDDVTGARQLVPGGPFGASVAAQLSPSTSPAWKHSEVQAMLAGVNGLESNRGDGAGTNTTNGVMTLQVEEGGGYTFEAGVTTIAPNDATKANITRRRIGDYIAVSFVRSNRGAIDAPNVPENQQDVVAGLDRLMGTLKRGQKGDPNHTPHVLDYAIGNLSDANSQAELDAGNYSVPLDVKESNSIAHLFLKVRHGEGVTVGS